MNKIFALRVVFLLALLVHPYASVAESPSLRTLDRQRAEQMLKVLRSKLEDHYYDPTYHGLDLRNRFDAAQAALEKAESLSHAFGIVAQAVLDLNDSHTFFIPPSRTVKVRYGWSMRMVGDTAFVLTVARGSDAEAKGLKVGDAVLSVNSIPPTRGDFWRLIYRYYTVRPEPGLYVVAQSPGGEPRRLAVLAKITQEKRVLDITQGEDIWHLVRQAEDAREESQVYGSNDRRLAVWQLPTFKIDDRDLTRLADRVHDYGSLVLDLRGNPGGYEKAVRRLLGYFFDHDVTVGQARGRKGKPEPVVAESRGKAAFGGKLAVLVDSDSASASELFARVIQLEKRGSVFGDRTAGAVMEAKYYPLQVGTDTVVPYGISISEAEILMVDGKSLEGAGVTPDQIVLPTGADLAAKRDPVLSAAARSLGIDLTPEKAGTLFPEKGE